VAGELKELHRASGGAWGGSRVDIAFLDMLTKLVSKIRTYIHYSQTSGSALPLVLVHTALPFKSITNLELY